MNKLKTNENDAFQSDGMNGVEGMKMEIRLFKFTFYIYLRLQPCECCIY